MGPWSLFLIASGGICLAMGGLHLVVALRRPLLRDHLWFGLCSLLVAAYCFLKPVTYALTAVDAHGRALQLESALGSLASLCLAWFVVEFSGMRMRWPAWVVTASAALQIAVNFFSPFSMIYRDISRVERLVMPWGEELALAVGTISRWRLSTDVIVVATAVLVVSGCIQLVRVGKQKRAVALALTLGLQIVIGGIYGPMVDAGWVRFPYLGTVAFLLAIVVMGSVLAGEISRASVLANQLLASETRWSELLEEIPLLVAIFGVDGTVRYANRFACQTLGYELDEVVGRLVTDFSPGWAKEQAMAAIHTAAGGTPEQPFESGSLTKTGAERRVVWSGVVIRDANGEIEGLMGIGADVTEQRAVAEQRDRVLHELEVLKRKLEQENLYLRDEIRTVQGFAGMVGHSDALKTVQFHIRKVAPTNTTVLIQGETGVGKELAARAVHEASSRSDRPFVAVNCAALPASLVESELFGHERGAFTDARERRLGRFELADGGTLFLDEISELPVALQPKLLRVLQQGEFERVGGSETHTADVRLIAATNRELKGEVEAGRFREDLYYRLNVYPITVPPLRERTEDIGELVSHFVPQIAARAGREIDEVPGRVLSELTEYHWPGNVRELLNVLERAVVTSPDTTLRLPEPLGSARTPAGEAPGGRWKTLEQHEREYLTTVLRATGNQIAGAGGAAEILGLNPSTLRSRLKKLGVKTSK